VKNVSAPLEFVNVAAGLFVSSQNATVVTVQLRGNSWLLDSAMPAITARVDVRKLNAGWHTIRLESNDLRLPPGVAMERVLPAAVSLLLASEDPTQK